MKLLIASLLAISAVSAEFPFPKHAVPLKEISGRIINGNPAEEGQFPWQVALYLSTEDGTHFCGGSLISPRWVVTAGHCADGVTSYRILLGSTQLEGNDPNRVELVSTEYYQHEGYNPRTLANDIAVIKLPEDVELNDYIQPIALASEVLEEGVPVTVSGWGKTSDASTVVSPTLNYVDLQTINNLQCFLSYGLIITDGIVCAVPRGQEIQSTCNGDSGGPLIVLGENGTATHVAVVSFVSDDGCESGAPSGYTRTAHQREWIREKTGV